MSEPFIIQAIILVANEEVLLKRTRDRDFVEPREFSNLSPARYPSTQIRKFYERVNLFDIYRIWIDELVERHIPYILIDASQKLYRTMESEEDLYSVFH